MLYVHVLATGGLFDVAGNGKAVMNKERQYINCQALTMLFMHVRSCFDENFQIHAMVQVPIMLSFLSNNRHSHKYIPKI
jgi:hypothetical protein